MLLYKHCKYITLSQTVIVSKARSVANRKTKRCLIFDAYDKYVCVITLQIGSYSRLDSSPHNIPRVTRGRQDQHT